MINYRKVGKEVTKAFFQWERDTPGEISHNATSFVAGFNCGKQEFEKLQEQRKQLLNILRRVRSELNDSQRLIAEDIGEILDW